MVQFHTRLSSIPIALDSWYPYCQHDRRLRIFGNDRICLASASVKPRYSMRWQSFSRIAISCVVSSYPCSRTGEVVL